MNKKKNTINEWVNLVLNGKGYTLKVSNDLQHVFLCILNLVKFCYRKIKTMEDFVKHFKSFKILFFLN